MESVAFKLSKDVVARLEQIARDEDISVGQLLRIAIDRDLRRRDVARTPARVDQRLLAPIRVRVTADFVQAQTWHDLKQRLLDKGCTIRESGGGLALHDLISGRFLCRTSEIGFGYPTLLRRFGAPFPGHSQTELLERIRNVPVHSRA